MRICTYAMVETLQDLYGVYASLHGNGKAYKFNGLVYRTESY